MILVARGKYGRVETGRFANESFRQRSFCKYPSHGPKWQPWSESVAATYDNL